MADPQKKNNHKNHKKKSGTDPFRWVEYEYVKKKSKSTGKKISDQWRATSKKIALRLA